MILVDTSTGSKELLPIIRGMGVCCEKVPLSYADACFEGNGPEGTISVGIERKTLHDMLSCIEDARYVSHQRIGMKKMYQVSILIIEGYWKPREDGMLMESKDGCTWWVCRPHGKPVMYSKLRRYLISIRYSGVAVNFTRNLQHTAYDICEEWHYHQKSWNKHTSLKEIQKLAIPQLNNKPSLTRMWAEDLKGCGRVLGESAEHYFRKPIILATADEEAWVAAGATAKEAMSIVRQIHGL